MFSFSLNSYKFFSIVFLLLILIACNDDDSENTMPDSTVELNNEVNEFVWNGLNSWYYFLDEVNQLNDNIDDNQDDFYTFLNGYSTPEELFKVLTDIELEVFQKEVNGQIQSQKFSVIASDYDELNSGFQAVYNSFGYDFILYRISDTQFIGQVRFVFPGSAAEEAGLERGDAFVEVDGQEITISNLESLLLDDDNYTLSMATINSDGSNYTISPTGEQIEITETNSPRSAIWVNKTIDLPGHKVGYLVYSNFENTLNEELNNAFGELAAEGVSELVLDLRYNPGGSVQSAIFLNSMIYSNDNNLLMGQLDYNRKHANAEQNLYFTDQVVFYDENFDETGNAPLNSLGLDRVFILTSSSTASASEFVINALQPYMDVVIIGETTVGKNVGSITLYDNPPNYIEKEGANANHRYGMQPIVSKIANSVGFADYESGFSPDIQISETDFLHDLKPLGDENEQLLAEALNIICTSCITTDNVINQMQEVQKVFETIQLQPNYQVADLGGIVNIQN